MKSLHLPKTALTALVLVSSLALASFASAQDAPANGMAPAAGSARPAMLNQKTFKLLVKTQQVGANGKTPLAGATVKLEAFAGEAKVKTYTATSDATGVALFDPLTAIAGVRYVPTVVHGGSSFPGAAIIPSNKEVEETTVEIFEKSYDDSKVRVTDLMTTVDLWEGYLVFTQTWSLVNNGPGAFDPTGAPGKKYADGFPIALPVKAQGVHATVIRGRGSASDARVIENRVVLRDPIPPAIQGQDPLRVQVRYSLPISKQYLEYTQPLEYPIDNMRVIVSKTTRHAKVPRMDLTLVAPGFSEVGAGQNMPSGRSGNDYLVARGRQTKPGDVLSFTVSGYPIPQPTGFYAALAAVIAVFLGGFFLYRKETEGGTTARRVLIQALEQEREDLFDDLKDLEDSYDDGVVSDVKYDIEAARLRERLALVLRRISQEEKLDAGANG